MNAYAEMKKRHQEEVNELPMCWAFSDEQFDQQLKKLGLTRNDTGKLCKTFGGGFCLASDARTSSFVPRMAINRRISSALSASTPHSSTSSVRTLSGPISKFRCSRLGS